MPTSNFVLQATAQLKDNMSAGLTTISSKVKETTTSIDQSNKVMGAVGTQVTKTQSSFGKLGTTLKSNAGSLTAVSASAWGLFNAFDDLEKKQLSVQRLQTRASQASNNLAKAQDKLAKIAMDQGKGSAEYAAQLKIVNLAQDKATQSAKKAEIAAGDLNEGYLQLAMQAGPMFAALGGSIAQMVSQMSSAGPAATGAAKGMGVLNTVSSLTVKGLTSAAMAAKGFLLSLGPIGIALIAIGVLFTLYATNAWGFADAVNGAGKAIIEGIGGIVTAVTGAVNQVSSFLTGFLKTIVSGNVPQALERIRDMIMGIYTKWIKPTFDAIFSYIMSMFNRVVSAFKGPIDAIVKGVLEGVNTILRILGDLGQGFLDAFAALASGDILGALSTISDAFTELATTILDALTTLFTEQIPALIAGLTDIFLKEGAKWLKAIEDIIVDILKAFGDMGKSIQDEAAKWLDFIMGGLGDLGKLGLDLGKLLAGGLSGGISIWDWDAAWKAFLDAVESTRQFFETAFKATLSAISGFFSTIFNGIMSFLNQVDWVGAAQALHDAFWATINVIKDTAINIFNQIYNFLANINWTAAVQSLTDAFNSSITAIFNLGKTIASTISDYITSWSWADAFQSLTDAFNSTVTAIFGLGQEIATRISGFIKDFSWADAFQSLTDAFNSTVTAIYNLGQSIASTIAGYIKFPNNLFQQLTDAFNSSITAIFNLGKTIASEIQKYIKIPPTLFQSLTDAFNSSVTAIFNLGKSIASTIQGFIKFGADTFKPLGDAFDSTATFLTTGAERLGQKVSDIIHNWNWADALKSTKEAFASLVDVNQAKLFTEAISQFGKETITLEGKTYKLVKTDKELKAAGDNLITSFGLLYAEVIPLEKGLSNIDEKMTMAQLSAMKFGEQLDEISVVSESYRDVIQEVGEAMVKDMFDGLVKTNAELHAQNILWGESGTEVANQINQLQEYNLGQMNVTRALGSTTEAQNLFNEGQIQGKQAMTDMINELIIQVGELDATNKAWGAITETESDQISMWQRLAIEGINVTQVLDQQKFALKQYLDGFKEGKQSVKDFVDEIVKGKGAYDGQIKALVEVSESLGIMGDASSRSAEQMEQLIGVAMRSPEALGNMASEIASLAGEARGFLEFSGEPQSLFGEWHFGEDIPDEIQGLFNDADRSMLAGQAQLERTMSFMGPAIGEHFRTGIANMDMSALQEFGPKAADVLRKSGAAIGPVVQELINSLDALGTAKGPDEMVDAMGRVMIALANVNDPTNQLTNNLIEMGKAGEITSGQLDSLVASGMITEDMANKVAAGVQSMHGGLAATSEGLSSLISDFDATAKAGKNFTIALGDLQQVTVTGLGTFAMLGGEMIKIKDAAGNAVNPLDSAGTAAAGVGVDASDAATKLSAFHKILTLIPQVDVKAKVGVDMAEAQTQLTAFHTVLTLLTQVAINVPITADVSQAKVAASQVAVAFTQAASKSIQNIAGIKKGFAPIAPAASASATSVSVAYTKAAAKSMQNIAGIKAGFPPITTAATAAANRFAAVYAAAAAKAIAQVARLRAAVNALPNITRSIIYKNVVPSPPRVDNINRTITYHRQIVGPSPKIITGVQSPAALNLSGDGGFSNMGSPAIPAAKVANVGGDNRPIVIYVEGKVNEKVLLKFIHTASMENVGAH